MKKLFIICALLLVSCISFADTKKDGAAENAVALQPDLYTEILRMDTIFFDAFNRQDLETIKVMFAEDLEFYHDKGGLSDYSKNLEASKKLFENNKTLKRELIRDSLKVYPIKDYGALQIGEHRFCHIDNEKNDCGIFKFTHIWRKVGDSWKLARVISYDH